VEVYADETLSLPGPPTGASPSAHATDSSRSRSCRSGAVLHRLATEGARKDCRCCRSCCQCQECGGPSGVCTEVSPSPSLPSAGAAAATGWPLRITGQRRRRRESRRRTLGSTSALKAGAALPGPAPATRAAPRAPQRPLARRRAAQVGYCGWRPCNAVQGPEREQRSRSP